MEGEEAGQGVDWGQVRTEFELDPDWVHLAAFWLSSHPRVVREGIEFHRRNLDRNPARYLMENEQRLDECSRQSIARVISANASDIALTASATEGLSVVYGGVSLRSEDEIVVSEHEHYSSYSCVRALSRRTGAHVRVIRLYENGDDVSPSGLVRRVTSAVSSSTRLLSLTSVHSSTGVALPIGEICEEVRGLNRLRSESQQIMTVVDGTHSVGVQEVDVGGWACDFLVASCHKWLYGPRGTGFIWVRPERAAEVDVIVPSFAPGALAQFTGADVPFPTSGEKLSPGGFHCFEHRWAVADAVLFLEGIGMGVARERVIQLNQQLKAALVQRKGVRLITPQERASSAGVVCFEVEGLSPERVVRELVKRKVVASVSPYRTPYARLTAAVFNNESEVEYAAECVGAISSKN